MAAGARYDAGTASRVLDVAEGLVQMRGFNGFSYADIAADLGITKAALHYHFAGKADLGLALIARYASRFAGALAAVDAAGAEPAERLAEYARLYAVVLSRGNMCLCGMLAAEYQTLPQPMRDAVTSFFDANEAWLEKVLEEGQQGGSLRFADSPRETARIVIACLEGAMLVARPYGDVGRFQSVAAGLLGGLRALARRLLRQRVGRDQQAEQQEQSGGDKELRRERGAVVVDLRAGRPADGAAALDHRAGTMSADQMLAAHLKPLPVGAQAHLA